MGGCSPDSFLFHPSTTWRIQKSVGMLITVATCCNNSMEGWVDRRTFDWAAPAQKMTDQQPSPLRYLQYTQQYVRQEEMSVIELSWTCLTL